MTGFPRPIEGGNSGDGSPLVLGDPDVIGDMFAGSSSVHVLDFDGDGERELVVSGGIGDIYSFKFVDSLPDGTPIVDRGMRWGLLSRHQQRDENDQGLTGSVAAAGDFDGDGHVEIILAPRGYSVKPTVVLSLEGGVPIDRSVGAKLTVNVPDDTKVSLGSRGTVAVIDWDGDGKTDLAVLCAEEDASYYLDPATRVTPEDQRDRYHKDGRWIGGLPVPVLHLFRNVSSSEHYAFDYAGRVEVQMPPHASHICEVNPNDPTAGLLVLGYYGDVWHLPLEDAGEVPVWGEPSELLTIHGAPFNRTTNLETTISVSDVFEQGRFDIFAGDKSKAAVWCRYHGQDGKGRPVYDTPKKLKQRNPHVNAGDFSVPTVGDWRGTGMPDLLVGSIEGYIFWYKTLSTDPLRFAPPERVRRGTEEIRRLAMPNPAAGHHWGGSQGPYDGNTGGYSNPVLVDWDDDGLLDLIVSDMVGLYDWYPNWGTKTRPELGHPRRLHVNGEPLFGPWRQQAGIGDFYGDGLPSVVIQDLDLDLALYRRAGRDDLTALQPGVKLRYEDGETIKTHGVYTPGGGDGRGRTKINVVDWDGDGLLDLLIGVGPQHGSPYHSYVLFAKNVGTNAEPVFKRPVALLFDADGAPLEFWRHGAHPAPVDWDGKYELLVGADQGFIWYWKPEHFGVSANPGAPAPLRPEWEEGLGDDR